MKIDLENKYFYYNKTVEFIFNELNKSSFLESKASRKNIGLIKWIYEKSPNICQGISFDEDNFFKIYFVKKNNFGDFGIYRDIFVDSENFVNIRITLLNIFNDFNLKYLKRMILSEIAQSIHMLSSIYRFERKNVYNNYYDIYKYNFSKEELISFNIGFRAEHLYYNIDYLKCIKDFIKLKKNIYSLKYEDYDRFILDVLNSQF